MRVVTSTQTLLGLGAAEWEAIGVWVTAGITLGLFVYAYVQLRDARELRIEQARPYIIVDLSFRRFLIHVSIKNTGQTAAKNVRVTFDEPLVASEPDRVEWQHSKPFTDGIPFMAPGREMRYLLDTYPARAAQNLPMTISGSVTYSGADMLKHDPWTHAFLMDMEIYKHARLEERSMPDLVNEVAELRKELGKWTDGSRGLLVQATDRDRYIRRSDRPFHLLRAKRARAEKGIRGWLGYFVDRWRERHGLYSR
jgi:hypothetical protein